MKVNVCLLDIRSSDRVTDQTWRKFTRSHRLSPTTSTYASITGQWEDIQASLGPVPQLDSLECRVGCKMEDSTDHIDGKIRYIKSLIPYSDWIDSFLNWNYHSFTFSPCPEISWSKISLSMPTCSPSPPYHYQKRAISRPTTPWPYPQWWELISGQSLILVIVFKVSNYQDLKFNKRVLYRCCEKC